MKGSILDIPYMIVLIMISVITVILVAVIVNQFNTAFTFGGDAQTVITAGVSALSIFDYMIIFYAVGVSLFSITSAFFVRSHPIFFIFSMIMLGVAIMFSAMMTNALDVFLTASAISSTVNSFPLTVIFVRNFPTFALIVGIIIAIVMYSKGDELSQGGSI